MQFPAEFFQEEIRCDFKISEMMKRAWAAELEILEAVDQVCTKHDLKYFAAGGTFIGAVRDKGFIPWDDDIDITMLREDYNKLIQFLPAELPDGIVVAGMYASNQRLQEAASIPHLRVIADEEYWSFPTYLNRFHGFPYPRIGIDIFPMDYISKNNELLEFQISACHAIYITISNFEMLVKENQLEGHLQTIEEACHIQLDRNKYMPTQLWQLFDHIIQLADSSRCDEVENMQSYIESNIIPSQGRKKIWYSDSLLVPYEHTTMRIAAGYQEALPFIFGDYMTPIKFASNHDYPFYQNQEAELRRMFDADGITTSIEEFCRNWMKANGGV